jgi:Restriction endonuclease
VDKRDARVIGYDIVVTNLRALYDSLRLPGDATPAEKRRRGHTFEAFLGELLAHEGLHPRIRLRPSGEEIDGSFEVDSRAYLLEAKWHATPLPASSVYAFKGKVDGKLAGTIGVFVSMSGYAEDAIDALTVGKVLNIILFDRSDVEAAIQHSFTRVLRAKLRAAAEEGVVFFPFTSTLAEVRRDRETEVTHAPNDATDGSAASPEVVIICESAADARVVSVLAQRILEQHSLPATLRIVAAQGKQGIPRLANTLHAVAIRPAPIIAVVDGNGHPDAARATVEDAVEVPLTLVVIDPQIEIWLEPDAEDPRSEARVAARRERKPFEQYLAERSASANLDELVRSAPGFPEFHDAIVDAATGAQAKTRVDVAGNA